MIPTWEITAGHKTKIRNICKEFIAQQVCPGRVVGVGQRILIEDIVPYDLGLGSWRVPGQARDTFATWVYHILPPNKAIIIYKIVQLSVRPAVNKLAFRSDSSLEDTICSHSLSGLYGIIPVLEKIGDSIDELQSQYGLENLAMEGWLDSPIIFSPSSRVQVDTFVDSLKAGFDELVLVGFTATMEGRAVNP